MNSVNINGCESAYIPSKEPALTMVNTSDTIRLIEDSVIQLVSLILMKILKRQWIYTVFLKIKAEFKKNYFIRNSISIY